MMWLAALFVVLPFALLLFGVIYAITADGEVTPVGDKLFCSTKIWASKMLWEELFN